MFLRNEQTKYFLVVLYTRHQYGKLCNLESIISKAGSLSLVNYFRYLILTLS